MWKSRKGGGSANRPRYAKHKYPGQHNYQYSFPAGTMGDACYGHFANLPPLHPWGWLCFLTHQPFPILHKVRYVFRTSTLDPPALFVSRRMDPERHLKFFREYPQMIDIHHVHKLLCLWIDFNRGPVLSEQFILDFHLHCPWHFRCHQGKGC